MTTAVTHQEQRNPTAATLFVAFKLSDASFVYHPSICSTE